MCVLVLFIYATCTYTGMYAVRIIIDIAQKNDIMDKWYLRPGPLGATQGYYSAFVLRRHLQKRDELCRFTCNYYRTCMSWFSATMSFWWHKFVLLWVCKISETENPIHCQQHTFCVLSILAPQTVFISTCFHHHIHMTFYLVDDKLQHKPHHFEQSN